MIRRKLTKNSDNLNMTLKNQIKEIENAISNNLIPVNGKVKSAS